jgi:hypothetical protein
VFLDGTLGDDEARGDAAVRVALCHQRQHLALARCQVVERVVSMTLRDQLLDECRVDDRAAGRDAPERVDDIVDPHHPALQEVPDAPAALEQVDRRLDLDVRGEQQDPDLRELCANRARGIEAFPGLGRRHADVDHRDVRHLLADDVAERLGVAHKPDHVEAGPPQEAGDPFPEEDVVLRNDDPRSRHLAGELTLRPS